MTATKGILIGGEWLESEESQEVIDPYSGDRAGVISLATGKDIEAAIVAAREGAAEMRRLQAYERSGILASIARAVLSCREELAEAITSETAKPLSLSFGEVDRAAMTFRIAAEEATRIAGDVLPMDLQKSSSSRVGLVQRFPIGAIVGITPFAFPLNCAAHKIAPAVASGNSLVLRPSTRAPLAALRLCELCDDAGLPAGGLNVVPCSRSLVRRLVSDERTRMLSFSGSAKLGWELKIVAGKKRVALDVGGNSAAVVEPDVDITSAAKQIALGAFAFGGQMAISVQRAFVHRQVFAEFGQQLQGAIKSNIILGDPHDPQVICGPLIDQDAADRIERWIAEAVDSGAKVLTGGARRGTTIEPTVLTNVDAGTQVWREEVFGPVLVLEAYDDFAEVLKRVNATPYGLQAGVFTNDVRKIYAAYRELDVGAVIVNDCPTYRVDHMPYGGTKDSGLGRTGVRYAIEQMTEPRLMVLNLSQEG